MSMNLWAMAQAISAELKWNEHAIIESASFFYCKRCGRLNIKDSLNHRGLCTRECEAKA